MAWFIDGLAEVLAACDDALRRRQPIRLVQTDDGYAIEQAGVRNPTPIHLERSGPEPRLVPAEAVARVKDHDVDLVLRPDHLLVRSLDPLPPESRPYLDNIVRHQLERLVPWRADNVLHSYRVTATGPRDEKLAVTVWATARSLHAPILAALAALGPRKLRLIYPGAAQVAGEVGGTAGGVAGSDDIAIDIDDRKTATKRISVIRQVAIAAVLTLLIGGTVALAAIGYAVSHADDELAATEQSVVELRKKMAARGGNPLGDRDLAAIVARRRAQPLTVLVIDALAAALPDDTWLTEFQIADGTLRVTGISRDVAQLVPLIEASPLFADAAFFAPTTRMTDGASDRFHLQSRLVSPKETRK